ncbi:MAG: diacylglycerol kinase family protein [Acidimicrobiales bacterium]
MKLQLIVNPKASAVTPGKCAAVKEALQDHDVTVVETLYRGHAMDLAREGVNAGCQVVVVLGGDGTLNEAANGLAGSDVAMACLPGGSTNVYARTLGWSRKVKGALRQLGPALERPPRRVGLGLVNGRYFLFHVGMGFDAAVVAQVEKRPQLKRTIGQGVFVYAAFATWLRHFDRTRPNIIVRDGETTILDDGYFAVCLKTNPYTYFGIRPLCLAPDAGLDTPLAMVTLRTLKLGSTLSLVGSAIGSGRKLRNHPQVDYRSDVTAITVVGHRPVPYQADGDYLGDSEQLTFTHEADRLLLVMP